MLVVEAVSDVDDVGLVRSAQLVELVGLVQSEHTVGRR
jgi:hypothetical protein